MLIKFKRIFLFYLLFFVGVTLSFGSGYLIRAIQDTSKKTEFPILNQAFDILNHHAYDEIKEIKTLEYGMIRGMLEAYGDPYTRFEEPIQSELATDDLEGKYGGIGASLEYDNDGNIILHPFPESPSKEVGILDGDQLVRVNDLEIVPFTPLDIVVAELRGPEGQWVQIEIIRHPELARHTFKIKREDILLPSVTWHLDSNEQWLGIIKVNLIAASTSSEIIKAVKDLQSHHVSHFILDLRDNRGGLLTAGIDISRLFLSDGTIIQEQYRDNEIKTYEVVQPGQLADLPLSIFVNLNTASAAEIIAGALQKNNRAIIIGTNTYGKDSIQLVFDLKDGSSLHVTAGKWWFPGLDYSFSDSGLQPDIIIDEQDMEIFGDSYIQSAIESIKGQP